MALKKAKPVTATEVAAQMQRDERALVISHEAPDGDALGCISAFLLMAERLGLPCRAFVPGETAFPKEYLFLPRLDRVERGSTPQIEAGTTVYLLDCASLVRSNSDELIGSALRVNIDHHQDNPGYGEMNLLDSSAPSTTSMLYEVFKAGSFPISIEVATALYVGLVTDTGRFQYSNTSPAAHRTAAELQEAGVDVNWVYRQLYETMPLPKLLLLQRALSHLKVRLGGALVVAWLGSEDFSSAGADEGHAEGIIDFLRRIQGVRVAALLKERERDGRLETKVSLRSTDGTVNVATLAQKQEGGGHVRAAGFTSDESAPAVAEWIERQLREQIEVQPATSQEGLIAQDGGGPSGNWDRNGS